ncbi:hypothetical protein GCM10009772_38040 [Pseudonocardia alni subsp. carboxydivorans]|uniref:Homeodomain-like domain-containing protein n=1 Tax=Pseudonocardia alni subsp. carboxydivorans TaxID=415010 RepID=A0ABU9ACH8_PSEA5|nr:hypothetical protein [Pseudonocardia sp. DR1-2]MCM3848826.1 hypothetical protein [Pseudonocardia sp. DR1-2]
MTTTERDAEDGAHLRDAAADDADAALAALAAQLEASVAELSSARERVAELQELRSQGLSWRAIVPREARPLIVETLTRTLDGLGAVGGRFRREEAVALHAEGETIAGIGRLFGVSRQRVSAYLQEHQQLLERCAARRDRPEA